MLEALSCIFRSSFLVVAVPLVALGGIFSEASLRLTQQGIVYLEYSIVESTAAVGLQEKATQNVAAATLAETEALEFQADAERLEGEAAASQAEADEEAASGSVTEAEGEVGSAAETAGVETVSEVEAAVEAAAAEAADSAAAISTLAETEAVAVGASEGSALAAGAAAEIATAGAAGAAGITAGTAASSVAAVAGTTAVVALTAPKVVKATESEWSTVSAVVQAGRDETAAAEEEAQAGALEASVPVLEEGAVAAERAGAESLILAVSFLTLGQLSMLLALLLQAPVAVMVLARWLCGTAVAAAASSGTLGSSVVCTKALSRCTLALALACFLLRSWGDTVAVAAKWQRANDIQGQLSALPELLQRASGKSRRLDGALARRAFAFDSLVGPNVTSGWEAILSNATNTVIGDVKGGVQKVSNVAGKVAETVATGVLVHSPNLHTTTVPPQTTMKPPEVENHFWQGAHVLADKVWYWVLPTLEDFALASMLFIVVEAIVGAGKHMHGLRSYSLWSVANLLVDVARLWFVGVGALFSVWIFSISMALPFEPVADHFREVNLVPLGLVFMVASLVVSSLHAHSLAKKAANEGDGTQRMYIPISMRDSEQAESGDGVLSVCSCFCGIVGAMGIAIVESIEGPTFSSALGASYECAVKTRYMLPLAPLFLPLAWASLCSSLWLAWDSMCSSPWRLCAVIGVFLLLLCGATAGCWYAFRRCQRHGTDATSPRTCVAGPRS